MTPTHDDVIAGLTLAEKAGLTSGADFWHTKEISQAGIPALLLCDGPHGLRKQSATRGDALGAGASDPATCFPPASGLGSSWNVDLVRAVGEAIGTEARAAQVAVVLGPGINIRRSPLCGRNFEYFSEDPVVSGRLAEAWVNGVQSRGVGVALKHFAANNQETDRLRVSVLVDRRTLREIYLPGFEWVVTQARPLTVMCAYNRINGVYASEDHWLLTELLRDEWGFEGAVVSDWGAVNDRVRALSAGLDITMPATRDDQVIVDAVAAGELAPQVLDRAVGRVLRLVQRTSSAGSDPIAVDHEAHHRLAHEAALECAVLLKNESAILPLREGVGSIAVVGSFARTPRYQGSGSSQVVPTRLDTALDAFRAAWGSPERVRFAAGFGPQAGEDAVLLEEAVSVAGAADTVVCFLGLPDGAESEGFDRTDLSLPANQLAVLEAVAAVNPRVVVVLSNGSVVSVAGWREHAGAIVEGWLMGQAGGSAIVDLLIGRANPSGRLTETIPLRLEDHPSFLNFPGSDGEVVYGERIYVGYRSFDTRDVAVAYPFGFGLSYTTFDYAGLDVVGDGAGFRVSFTVTNSGQAAGAEVAQIYVRDIDCSVDRPIHELKGFAKVHLRPGQSQVVSIVLDERAFAYWSLTGDRWVVEAGEFEIQVGASSRDIRLRTIVVSAGDGWSPALSGMSLLSEWLTHPVGGPLLVAAMQAGPVNEAIENESNFDASSVGMQVALAMPLVKLASFVPGLDPGAVDQLVTAARAAETD